jgi:hypothetical protein
MNNISVDDGSLSYIPKFVEYKGYKLKAPVFSTTLMAIDLLPWLIKNIRNK